MTDFLSADFSTMTVAQLTALCREHKITGYSKQKKAVLIEKLNKYRTTKYPLPLPSQDTLAVPCTPNQQFQPNSGAATSQKSSIPHSIPPKASAAPMLSTSRNTVQSGSNNDRDSSAIANEMTNHGMSMLLRASSPSPNTLKLDTTLSRPSGTSLQSDVSKRPGSMLQTGLESRPVKKRRLSRLDDNFKPVPEALDPVVVANRIPFSSRVQPSSAARLPVLATLKPAVKGRFVPLKPVLKQQIKVSQPTTESHVEQYGIFQPFVVQEDQNVHLQNITIPPSLSQRKRVKGLALILRDLSDHDRRRCCFANRLLRYAVYVSAQFVLCEEFPGRRTETVLARAQDCYSNFWPYLRLRRQEVRSLKKLYSDGFLSRFVPNPISNGIWANPDRGDEAASVLRFILSRLWFAISVYGDAGVDFLSEQITKLKPLVGDELWEITTRKSCGSTQTLLVLAMTGEAIGSQQDSESSSRRIRQDWGSHIVALGQDRSTSIWKYLRCANEEDFERGISKLWLKRIANEDHLGAMKRAVAQRYVMASVVANSVSGKAMNHQQMASEVAGIPVETNGRSNARIKAVHLFLSEHHHVESVHFTTSSSIVLHPAVASVQTTHREYFVLRENGLQIGSEEEGVAEIWMSILGCARDGSPCK